MTVHLGILYHWSPREARDDILRQGLRIMMPNRDGDAAFPWVCLGTTPSSAWGLLPAEAMEDPDGSGWDLWQVSLAENDAVHYRSDFGPVLREIRVENSIPPDRLWWVGCRYRWPHEGEPE